MKILLANSTCKVGGVSTFLLSLRRALAALGHDTALFFFERGPMEARLPGDCDVRFGTLADLMELVERRGVDVVHANNVDWPTGISAVRGLGARLVVTAHKVREPAWTYGWHAGNCDAFVAVSRWIRDELQAYTDIPIQVVHNGIDTERFRPGEDTSAGAPIVAWVGRGSAPRKRLDAFAAVAPRLREAGLRVWVIDSQDPQVFADAFPDAAGLLREAAEQWGGVAVADMPAVYQRIAASGGCVVSTASMEGLPLTLLEAQACGCPVIAATARGVDECVAPDHGGVLHPRDMSSGDIARLIVGVLHDFDGARARGRAAAGHVAATFSLRMMAERYLGIYSRGALPPVATRGAIRWRHSPLLHWRAYLDERLGVGYAQYQAALDLATRGQRAAAAAAARESIRTAPTMYAHPRRAWRLGKMLMPRFRTPVGGGLQASEAVAGGLQASEAAASEAGARGAADKQGTTRMGNRVA